jgi:hypothetical protein
MADYFRHSIFQPFIPKHLLSAEDREFFELFGITVEELRPGNIETYYLYADEWCTEAVIINADGSERKLSEDDLFQRFQEIIRRSNGELSWISQENSYTCNRMRPGGFGGSAIFITENDVQYVSTSEWLTQRVEEAKTGDFGPQVEVTSLQKLILGVILEGGLVHAIVTNAPDRIPDMDIAVIDYDIEDYSGQDILDIPQHDGSNAQAAGHLETIALSGFDLQVVLDQLKGVIVNEPADN